MKELLLLLRSVSKNVNQIARRCSETGNLYEEDMEDLRKGMWQRKEEWQS